MAKELISDKYAKNRLVLTGTSNGLLHICSISVHNNSGPAVYLTRDKVIELIKELEGYINA